MTASQLSNPGEGGGTVRMGLSKIEMDDLCQRLCQA